MVVNMHDTFARHPFVEPFFKNVTNNVVCSTVMPKSRRLNLTEPVAPSIPKSSTSALYKFSDASILLYFNVSNNRSATALMTGTTTVLPNRSNRLFTYVKLNVIRIATKSQSLSK